MIPHMNGICIGCLRGYVYVDVHRPEPRPCRECKQPVRELATPVPVEKFDKMLPAQREDLHIAPWVPGHAAVLVAE